MSHYNSTDENSIPEERPKFLLVLCILTWVSTGFSLLAGVGRLIGGPLSAEKMKEGKIEMLTLMNEMRENGMDSFAEFFAKTQHMTEVFNANHYGFYSLTVFNLLIGIAGAYLMYNAKKLGFHLYIIYSILGVSMVYFYLSPEQVPTLLTLWGAGISAIFIFMYSRNLAWLK